MVRENQHRVLLLITMLPVPSIQDVTLLEVSAALLPMEFTTPAVIKSHRLLFRLLLLGLFQLLFQLLSQQAMDKVFL
jgi:hypothetical protein